MATVVTHIVRPTGAGAGEYSNLDTWLTDTQRDLVLLDEIEECVCYGGDVQSGAAIGGFTTDATRYIVIKAAPGAEATMPYDSGQFRVNQEGASGYGIDNRQGHIRFENIWIRLVTSLSTYAAFRSTVLPAGAEIYLTNVIAEGVISGGATGNTGFNQSTNGAHYYFKNCVAYGFSGTAFSAGANSGVRSHLDNCLAYNCGGFGFHGWNHAGNYPVRNCIAQLCTSGGFNGFNSDGLTNISDDLTAFGTGSQTGVTLDFVSVGTGDFHLAATDTEAIDQGTDLSADADNPFNFGFDGITRPQGSAWDIGPTEYVAAGGGGTTLVVNDLSHTTTHDSASLVQANVLVVEELSHALSSEVPALIQGYLLAPADLAHTFSQEAPELHVAGALAVASMAHSLQHETPALVQANLLVVQELAHAHTLGSFALSQGYTLSVQKLAHALAVEAVNLMSAGILGVDGLAHALSLDPVVLTQANLLEVHDMLFGHTLSTLTLRLAGWQPLEFNELVFAFQMELAREFAVQQRIPRTFGF